MITDLIEGKKVKADQYWPDQEDPVLRFEDGLTVEYLSHTYPGTYIQRSLKITTGSGSCHLVEQIHCMAWRDMAAPSDTKVTWKIFNLEHELLLKTQPKLVAKLRPRPNLSPS